MALGHAASCEPPSTTPKPNVPEARHMQVGFAIANSYPVQSCILNVAPWGIGLNMDSKEAKYEETTRIYAIHI